MTQPTPMQVAAPTRRPVPPWPIDVINGAFRGDYTPHLGVMGYLTQGLLGFMPVIGSCCAFRDMLANMKKRDRTGVALNAFSLLPVIGGFPKTANAIRCFKNATQVFSTAVNAHHAIRDGHKG